MTSGEPSPPPDGPLSPEEVSGREFPAARKGYDRAAVRAFLETVASTIEVASERIADLERRLARAAVTSGEAAAAVTEGLLEAVSAEEWRDDVLADLDRRRRELNAEVVRLRAGRDRLRAELGEVMSDVAEQIRRLDGLLQTAREAGDVEEQRVRAEPDLSVEERRAELEAARLAGFVTVGRALLGPGEETGRRWSRRAGRTRTGRRTWRRSRPTGSVPARSTTSSPGCAPSAPGRARGSVRRTLMARSTGRTVEPAGKSGRRQ